jgi:hypothetical protein
VHNPKNEPELPDVLNSLSRRYLADTDWYVVREFETGVEVPTEVLTKRAAARLAIEV